MAKLVDLTEPLFVADDGGDLSGLQIGGILEVNGNYCIVYELTNGTKESIDTNRITNTPPSTYTM